MRRTKYRRGTLTGSALLLAAASLLVAPEPVAAQIRHARVAEGLLAGKAGAGITSFLGIPYAAPPTGERRWKAPEPAAAWQGERPADHFAASCQQTLTPQGFGPWTHEYVVQGDVGEDCLYLNVWTPARSAVDHLPVMVWIHGGGFASGSGSVPIYDGAALARQGIVVVTINYRLGVYGFLAHPGLTEESSSHSSGNYGLLDQVAALRWVQANITAFGGDAKRVTIAGQSAGAFSVHLHIASPLSSGLFRQAIAQSGSGMGLTVPLHAAAEDIGEKLSSDGVDHLSIADLRNLTPAQLDGRVARLITPGPFGMRFGPTVDGIFMPADESVDSNTNDTPILTGMTANEMSGLDPNLEKITAGDFHSLLLRKYGPLANTLAALYPARTDEEAVVAIEKLVRDRGMAAMYLWGKRRLTNTRHPIYTYVWNHAEPGRDAGRYKAFHSSEIPYVFDTLRASTRPFTELDRLLAAQLSRYWANFVKSGNPNDNGRPEWPTFSVASHDPLELGQRSPTRLSLSAEKIAAFETFQRDGGQVSLLQ